MKELAGNDSFNKAKQFTNNNGFFDRRINFQFFYSKY